MDCVWLALKVKLRALSRRSHANIALPMTWARGVPAHASYDASQAACILHSKRIQSIGDEADARAHASTLARMASESILLCHEPSSAENLP